MKKMTKEEITKKLQKKGHAKDIIEMIHREAEKSSNPEYIYHYWGVR